MAGGGTHVCELTLVGLFHRDPTNLRFVCDAINLSSPDAIALEARQSFLPAYGRLGGAVAEDLLGRLMEAPLRDLQETLSFVSLEERLEWHASLVEANQAAEGRPDASLAESPGAMAAAASSFSSALSPHKLLCCFAARELALSEKVAAAVLSEQLGLPLHGIEVDDPAAYARLAAGPLTGGAPASPGALAALEEEARRLAFACLPPAVAQGFRQWMAAVPPGHMARMLEMQLVSYMPQCMGPDAYLSYVDATEALWSDEARVGRDVAAQHHQLTVGREAHFLSALQQLAASGGRGGGPCRRLVAVVGRTHATRLRRTLQRAEAEAEARRRELRQGTGRR
ncbi:hypothetical protein HYH03_004418 [Edaphochlamys debaryana]|uniref:Uncharacterized protein n=1 Tax=Edaphochlamys debaryana TaxID=47281 RepID=A0A836C262_9CHLO|nr:hypothetical protein HYH03_004418 [Edaphochlamys debaryana]|eukprot:KAG2497681.1 hypothetical protein HYH03_004418 [Edaphochlamys debaryana]